MRGLDGEWLKAIVLGTMLCASPLHATEDPASTLRHTLEQRFPKVKIDDVRPAPLAGLYQIIAGGQVAYTDSAGDYLFVGRLMDTRTRHDLSAEYLDAHSSIDFRKLPFDKAIKIVKGDGRRQLAMFADPDCPYCQQLEKDLRGVTDLTVYVFLFPLKTLHPDADAHAHAIWCSPDRPAAWTGWMLDRKPPSGSTCAGDPIDSIQTLASTLQISSTPTLFLENGHRIGGAVSADELQRLLVQASVLPMATELSHRDQIIAQQ